MYIDKDNVGEINVNGFDHIVSLGYNCEVSYRIKEYTRKDIDSYPLSWAYMLDQRQIVHVLEHINEMLTENLKLCMDGMFSCDILNVKFHTKVSHENLKSMNSSELEIFKTSALEEMQTRFSYLLKKMEKL